MDVRPRKCALDVCLLALNFVPDWFVPNKMIKKLDDSTTFVNKDSDNVTFLVMK